MGAGILEGAWALAVRLDPGHVAALAALALTVLVMRGQLGHGIGMHEIFREQRAHADAIAGGARWGVLLSPAFSSVTLFTLWAGVLLHLSGVLPPPALPPPGGWSVPAPGWIVLALLALAMARWGGAPGLGRKPGERRRRLLGAAAGLVVMLAVSWLLGLGWPGEAAAARWLPGAAVAAGKPLILALAGLVVTVRYWTQTCAAWFMLLIFLTALVAWLAALPFGPPVVLAAAAGIVLSWRLTAFRYRIPGIPAASYDTPIGTGAPEAAGAANLLAPASVLAAWKPRAAVPAGEGGKPRLVVLAVSGGAYRASFWTAAVLDGLARHDPRHRRATGQDAAEGDTDALDGLTDSIRFIAGASGGMVAGAYLAEQSARVAAGAGARPLVELLSDDILAYQTQSSQVAPPSMPAPRPRPVPVPRDSLSAVAWRLVRDLGHILWPFPVEADRGRVLEAQWRTLMRPFALLREEEERGLRPSLLFSPMLVESGAPLFISNLDLADIRRHYATEDIDTHSAELFRVLPAAHHPADGMTVATAARLSATFPYVSPAVSLPTRPHRRVVDAGYYDNYGIDAATGLLNGADVRDWVVRNCGGVVVIAVRAFPDTSPADQTGPVGRLLWWLTSPLQGMFAARASSQTFRNRELLRLTRELYGLALQEAAAGAPPPPGGWRQLGRDFVEVVTFTCSERASMSWHVSDEDFARIAAAARAATAAGAPDMKRLAAFWQSGGPAVPAPGPAPGR